MHEAIELRKISKSFGKHCVLEDISCNFSYGTIYGIVGPNGCGKSVLFKIISGLITPTSGKIYVGGKKISHNGSMPESIGILIESPGFLPELTGYENLQILASINNIIDIDEISRTLELVGLKNAINIKVRNYSLGMLQRLGVAQAIMEKPQILILDEPFNGMDQAGVLEMRGFIKEYVKNHNAVLLVSSHNNEDINYLCDEILTIKDGHITCV